MSMECVSADDIYDVIRNVKLQEKAISKGVYLVRFHDKERKENIAFAYKAGKVSVVNLPDNLPDYKFIAATMEAILQTEKAAERIKENA